MLQVMNLQMAKQRDLKAIFKSVSTSAEMEIE